MLSKKNYLDSETVPKYGSRVTSRDFGMGGDSSPPIGGGDKGPMGVEGLARKSRQNLEGSQISEECE